MPLRCKQSTKVLTAAGLAIAQVLFMVVPAMCTQAVAGSVRQHRARAVHILGVSLDLSKLQLTGDQEQRIKDARKFARLKLHELKLAKNEKVAQLKTMLFDSAVTESQIKLCGEEIQRLQTAVDNVNLDSLIQLRAILTPEQRSQLATQTSSTVALAAKNRI